MREVVGLGDEWAGLARKCFGVKRRAEGGCQKFYVRGLPMRRQAACMFCRKEEPVPGPVVALQNDALDKPAPGPFY